MVSLIKKLNFENISSKAWIYAISFGFLLVCSHFRVYTPFSPVAITMHTFAIAILGYFLPFRAALAIFSIYFLDGLMGFGLLGPAIGLGVKFGYYIGMIGALLFLSHYPKSKSLFLGLTLSTLIIWFFGVLHLQFLIGIKSALTLGVVPFVIGDSIKILMAYAFIKTAIKAKEKQLN